MDSLKLFIKVVLIDDGSPPPLLMQQLAQLDPYYYCVFLSRNYGHRLAYNGIFNFNEFPFKLMVRTGAVAILISHGYFFTVVIKEFFFTEVIDGFTALLFVIILFSGVQLLALGINGEYMFRIFFQAKGGPLFIIKEEIINRQSIRADAV